MSAASVYTRNTTQERRRLLRWGRAPTEKWISFLKTRERAWEERMLHGSRHARRRRTGMTRFTALTTMCSQSFPQSPSRSPHQLVIHCAENN